MAQHYPWKPQEFIIQDEEKHHRNPSENGNGNGNGNGNENGNGHLDVAEIKTVTQSKTVPKSKLNARAPEFVPRSPLIIPPRLIPPLYVSSPLPFFPVSPLNPSPSATDHEFSSDSWDSPAPSPSLLSPHSKPSVLTEDLRQKIVRQVEYYFSDVNLSNNDYLMKFVSKDPDGYVPISVIASFKKIKGLVSNSSLVAAALKTSTYLVVSEDGKKVKRITPLPDTENEELQSRTIVAENLPDHSNEKIEKIFSAVGKVKSVRICQPQAADCPSPMGTRYSKTDKLISNKMHALVEFESVEQAEKAVSELNDERNWRSGLRVRLLLRRMGKVAYHPKGRKTGTEHHDGIGEEAGTSTSDAINEKHAEDSFHMIERHREIMAEDQSSSDKEGGKRSRGRGCVRGHGRGQHHNVCPSPSPRPTPNVSCHSPGQRQTSNILDVQGKHPPGPRMPDGTRGFTFGRGKQLANSVIS
eukprot:TRINITY_DN15854_c0_g1_i1.p1 TRINITY_DN15854_c0_g1~~TRINITY_DN15854_c0_g1_i1.p1  ORF type:complete len:469 (+),score=110.23 TRINITY_DN15854_c0_g1_i1:438-1844(+)